MVHRKKEKEKRERDFLSVWLNLDFMGVDFESINLRMREDGGEGMPFARVVL